MTSSFNQNNYNSLTLGNNSNYNLSTYNNNEFKDKDTDLTREIRYECLKTLKSFVNTTVSYFVKFFLKILFKNLIFNKKVWHQCCSRKQNNFNGYCNSYRL